MLNDEFLTQDIDILPGDSIPAEDPATDIFPEGEPEEVSTEVLPDEPATETETVTEPTADSELEELLAGVTTSTEEVSTSLEDAWSKVEEIKDKVEEVQSNPEGSDAMLKEIYQDLLETATTLQATEIAKDVALSKVSELQAQVSELEINAAGQYNTDNPDLMIINKLLNAAEGGSDVASPKVKAALNKIYLSLFNTSIEDGTVQDNIEEVNGGVTLNEASLPTGEVIQEEEPIDINNIMSILG